ncbi:hypothetical protein [Absidia glauca]|uniref:AIG1-type G domain-containing protein n=1 Tax=Absidia glauca TaxID=4829 RepID=A0A168PUX6_ABSGL|nr:hypothetical protein [Absidia glauca]
MMEDNPFQTTESDFDPIMVAARLAYERRASTITSLPSPSPLVHQRPAAIMTPSFSTTTSAQQDRKPIWRHSRTADHSPLFAPRTTFTKPVSQTSEPIAMMVLGKTGDGKSSLLNDILGHEVFKQKASVKSQTKDVVEKEGFWAPLHPYLHGKQAFGCNVRVYDTPGFGDSMHRDGQFLTMIQHRIQQSPIHCFLLVFKVTTNEDHIFKTLDILQSLFHHFASSSSDIWPHVILVFTHADLSTSHRYQSNKVALKTRVVADIKERYGLVDDLPMVFLSTQKYTCSYLKGLGDCDCERGNRYNADSRRRLYEQVWKRRTDPLVVAEPAEDTTTQHDQDDDDDRNNDTPE